MFSEAKKAAVFGAGGRTGKLLLAELPYRGWNVQALARKAGSVPRKPAIDVVAGDARNSERVAEALEGVKVAFCCLGMSDITVPSTDFSDSVRTIVSEMERAGVRRLIAIGSVAVLDDPAGGYRAKSLPPVFVNVAAEHLRNLETLRSSSLDWTLMCPATLRDDIPAGSKRISYEGLAGDSDVTGYADLAKTMIELIDDESSFRKRVSVLSEA